ncbi:MAG: GtrA family protein [Hyphomicrobium sp.]|nr:MAG: GtrA family protein [Hyphomicrobium sp.]
MKPTMPSLRPSWPAFAEPLLRHDMLPQLLRYAFVSGLALTLDFSVFLGLNGLIGHPTFSGVCGYAAGIVLHYVLSRRFVFDVRRSPKAAHRLFVEFVASGIVGLLATAGVIALATGLFGVAPVAAKLLAAAASFIGVFLIRRTVVFA